MSKIKIQVVVEIPKEKVCYDPRKPDTICQYAECFYCNLFCKELTDARVINLKSKKELKSMEVLPCEECLEKRKAYGDNDGENDHT